jgi:hypothetical protein
MVVVIKQYNSIENELKQIIKSNFQLTYDEIEKQSIKKNNLSQPRLIR